MKPGVTLRNLRIDGVDDEGRGRAVVVADGHEWDVAVRGGLPGDVVGAALVEVEFAARKLVQARRLDELRGPLHIERSCGHTGPCPACPLHGVDEGFVAAFKRERVRTAFAEAGVFGDRAVDVAQTVQGDGQRQKMKLVMVGKNHTPRLGHYVPHTHDLGPGPMCGVVSDAMVEVVGALHSNLYARGYGPDIVKAVVAREFVDGVGVVVVANAPLRARGDLRALRPAGCSSLSWRVDEARGNSLVGGSVVDVDGDPLGTPLDGGARCAVDAFCQADVGGAAWLVERAAAFVAGADVDEAGGLCFDLYAGTGAFARALLRHGASSVVAVEVADVSVRALSSITGVTAIGGRVGDVVEQLRARGVPRGLVVDPPKQGLKEDAAALAGLGAARVAVVSCDVDNGAKDVKAFVDKGYVVVEVVPVDLFPGSAEVEVLTLLKSP